MRCEDLLRMLNDYVDGEIDPSVCELFEGHLDGCDPCRIVVDTTRRTIRLFRACGEVELPAPARQRLHELLRERWKERGTGAEA